MQGVPFILIGMATLVASGVIMDRGHQMGVNRMSGLDILMGQGVRGGLMGDTLTRDQLVQQKMILDILHQIHMPLQNHDLLMLDDLTRVTNEDNYMRPLTQEMHMVLTMLRNREMLGKHATCSIHSDEHIRQMIGLYRLMVNARDIDTLMRLIVHTRQNVNTEMFVNCLVLALGERQDTQMLIVPALHEILPQHFVQREIIDQIRHLDTGISTLRPGLMDVMGVRGLHNPLWQTRMPMQEGGMWDILNRAQMWMPWREMHKEMNMRRMMNRNTMIQNQMQMGRMNMGQRGGVNMGGMNMGDMTMGQMNMGDMTTRDMDSDKVIVSLPGQGLLTQDLSLKSHVSLLIDELIVNQDMIRGMRGIDRDITEREGMWNSRRRMNMDDEDNDENDMIMNSAWRRDTRDVRDEDTMMMRNRDMMQGSRLNIDTKHAMDRNRIMMGGRRGMNNGRVDNDLWNMRRDDNNDDTMTMTGRRLGNDMWNVRRDDNNDDMMGKTGRRLGNRLDMDDVTGMNRNWHMGGGRRMQQDQPGINTVSINDARLLFVGRRSKNPNKVVTLGRRNNMEDMHDEDMISGGRRVSKEDRNNKNERQTKWQDKDEDMFRMKNMNRRGMMWNMDEDDDLMWQRNGMIGNSRSNWQNRGINMDDEDMMKHQDRTMNMGRSRMDLLDMIKRNRMGDHTQIWNDNDDLIWQDVQEGRRVDKRNRDMEEDEQDQHGWTMGDRRGNRNMDWTRLNVQRNWQNDNMNRQQQNWGLWTNDRISNNQRHKRSLDNRMDVHNIITGKCLMHTLQQLVARLNIERISLGLPQLMEVLETNNVQGLLTRTGMTTTLQEHKHNVDVQTLKKIESIIEHVDHILQQRINEISSLQHNQKLNQIGLMLAGQIEEIGWLDLMREVIDRPVERGQLANVIENEAVQLLMAGIVKVVDRKLQQISQGNHEVLDMVKGVNINNVLVDRLQTHMELSEVDLSNLLDTNMQEQTKRVVGRMPRLNHKTFNIQIDVNSERQQQVMVRHLLVPKVDGHGRTIPLRERRQNVIVLDVNTVQLQSGRNTLNLRSHDITLTSRDTTPLTTIYRMVLKALNGNMQLSKHTLQGQKNMLPHHLVLPRGRTNGLPMQLITVITPVETMDNMRMMTTMHRMNGLETLLQDRLPMTYPLHGDISALERVMSMPNVMVKDVMIYHDDHMTMMNQMQMI